MIDPNEQAPRPDPLLWSDRREGCRLLYDKERQMIVAEETRKAKMEKPSTAADIAMDAVLNKLITSARELERAKCAVQLEEARAALAELLTVSEPEHWSTPRLDAAKEQALRILAGEWAP